MRAVLITIADAANRDGEHARPGVAAMVEGALYGKSHVSRVLRRLVEDGWLEVTEQGNGRGNATTYRVLMDRETTPLMGGLADETPPLVGGLVDGNLPISAPKPPHFGAETSPSGGSVPLSPTVKNNGNDQRAAPPPPASPPARVDARPTFDDFWTVYPRRTEKKAALEAWDKAIKTADPEAVVAGAARYRDDPNRDPTYTVYPATWLNRGRWDDDPHPPREARRRTNLEVALEEQHAMYEQILGPRRPTP